MATTQDETIAELQRANAELRQERDAALAQKVALAEVLDIINRSPGDPRPVFDAILDKAHQLCGAAVGSLMTYDGTYVRARAARGFPEEHVALIRQPFRLHPFGARHSNHGVQPKTFEAGLERLIHGDRLFHIADFKTLETQPDSEVNRSTIERTNVRSCVTVPLRKDGAFLGYISAFRLELRPFSEAEIALLESFAAQAVIAIENARLITEQREALEQQTATAEVLQVINASPGNLTPVFDAILEKAHAICGAEMGSLQVWDGAHVRALATLGYPAEVDAMLRRPFPPGPNQLGVLGGERLSHRTDATLGHKADNIGEGFWGRSGIRTNLQVPLRKDGDVVGFITANRREVRPFSEKEISLLENFAAQAVIAMENARLIDEIRTARDDAEAAFRELKAAQANLIQVEKMASLGQLTAGIAHEIKNPLNFVNNFSALSAELIDELREVLAPKWLGDTVRAEVDDLTALLKSNLEKVVQHGQRADGIVKAMLEHSRGSSAERRMVCLNAVIDEALNLAYHGARAQDQSFNITLERDFGDGIAPIEVNPQDITRVFLNIFSNGFYAATRRARNGGAAEFLPTLKVTTRDAGDAVEIRVRDNGTGIPADIRDKLFQPFFTTKPTGDGTGLGLSITYDIVTKQHGGTISVDSEVGEYSEFTIRLPRRMFWNSGSRD